MGYMQAVFQFHYGAIKTNGVEDCIGAAFCFNSIMVRLRPTYTIGHLYNVTEFQFHYGTIKTSARLVDKLMLQAFQFHYGTIKTPLSSIFNCPLKLFQFHYGTIKTRRLNMASLTLSHFNSIMVRLRQQPVGTVVGTCLISIPLWYD